MSEPYKPKASWFAIQGDKYLGKAYSEMDCQGLVEQMLKDVGIFKDWRGSNHMWREALSWKGTPEECVKQFGRIPEGAWLFILKTDGGEKARGYNDSEGNASHVGVCTGRGKGAINSSASKGKVCESAFAGKTIPNGGWNRVGLCKLLNYELDSSAPGQAGAAGEKDEKTKEDKTMTTGTNLTPAPVIRYVALLDGQTGTVNLRASRNGKVLARVKTGTAVEELKKIGDWSQVKTEDMTGWMMTKFLAAEPLEEPEAVSAVTVKVGSEVTLRLSLEVAKALYDALMKCDI